MPLHCIFCSRECKSSDSRPYPNSKSQDRIHNKCHIKKSLAEKQSKSLQTSDGQKDNVNPESSSPNQLDANSLPQSSLTIKNIAATSTNVLDTLIREREESKRAEEMKDKMDKLSEVKKIEAEKSINNSGQFFFDLKAGIAKPHEKRKYLHHRSVREIAARYDDECFKEEALGRSYDPTGKDLNSLGDSDQEHEEDKRDDRQKRKYDSREHSDKPNKPSRVKIDDKNPCWFCFSTDSIEKHLVIAVGRHCYLTLAKGGLTEEHMLILPIKHIESINSKLMSSEIMDELERFKHSLVKYFQQQSKDVIFFERNLRSAHWQLQAVPLAISDDSDNLGHKIKSISKKYFDKVEYLDIPPDCLLRDKISPEDPYFHWQVEPVGHSFATQIKIEKGSFFPIQFGRMVLSDPEMMNCPDRVDWKNCSKAKEVYVRLVESVKRKYEDFDFTND